MVRKRQGWTKRKPETIDDYLAHVPSDQRNALERLRRAIHAVAPGAEECISYSLPAFRLQGRLVACFGATPTHCAYYPMSGTVVEKLKHELRTYDTSKGTIRFRPDKPLSVSLIRKLLRVRLQELA
jgi:uncharacterized protein YdhG (YjbR/CyaY superfamily)